MPVLAGIACGLVAAAPFVWVLGADSPSIGLSIAGMAFALLFMPVTMLVARSYWPHDVLAFGASGVLVFLACVVVAAIHRELSHR